MADRQSVECSVCNRILWVEDGPICQDCRLLAEPIDPNQVPEGIPAGSRWDSVQGFWVGQGLPLDNIEEAPPEALPIVVLSEPEVAPVLEVVPEAPPEAVSEPWVDDTAESSINDPEAAT